ncbi:unnamed protein product [Hermetia illucens]|uniref:UBX domain-containing protein 1 n=1 Tax=Hermetia illucens TaxID=343691 RepID=A0A7R8YP00_HERIL|nr:UBX domain-containing protein 1 [Hermetia illucens]CAD7079786.1 unnamed protein product [Hermetia illucens]
MSSIQTLIDMGFDRARAERALQVTNNKGVEPAMEWLLAHADEDIPSEPQRTVAGDPAQASPDEGPSQSSDAGASTSDNGSGAPKEEAKSLRCDACSKLFVTSAEMEFHAAKTGHTSFSESTEEKKPLSEEEKKAQLALIEEKLKKKRAEREEQERSDALEKEKLRIKSGKDMTEAKRKMEEMEMKKIVEQRKREKEEEKAARDRVRAQIEADKAARKARLAAETGHQIEPPTQPVQSPATSSTTSNDSTVKKEYTSTRIQIRLQDGRTLTETFGVKEQLSAVKVFIQMKSGNDLPFGLMTSFPRKVFTEEDFEKPLEILGLVPSAVIIVTRAV